MLENKLNELNIFALRDLARKTGVSSPTSKKKEQLIKEIVEIMSGVKKPEEVKTKQGRPPKVFGYNFTNMFNNPFSSTSENMAIKTLKQKEVPYEGVQMITVAGWLELVNNNAAIMWVNKNFKNENYFVPSEVLKGLDVKTGDRVVAEISLDENQKIVKEIFSINDYPILELPKERVEYDNIEHCFLNKNLEFAKDEYNALNLKVADNTYVYGVNNAHNTTTIIDMLINCKIENKLYINVAVTGKNLALLNGLKNTENFISFITDENDVAVRIVSLAVERAKRILETGEDVLVVVDDMASVLGLEKMGLSLIKNLVSIAKQGKGYGAISLLAVMPNENFNQIEKLADKRLRIDNNITVLN